MSSPQPVDDAGKNQVREALRSQKVKLWEPPYVNDQGEPSWTALEHLASSWSTHKIVTGAGVTQMLQEWQSHALTKLAAKRHSKSPTTVVSTHSCFNLEIKILGTTVESIHNQTEQQEIAETIHMDTTKKGVTMLSLKGVSTSKTDRQLAHFVTQLFPNPNHTNLRFIHRGKNLTFDQNVTLGTLFQETNVSLLALVSATEEPQRPDSTTTTTTTTTSLQTRIAAIRTAARWIRDTTQMDITDQHGKVVPMSGDDRLGFLTALALHRLGLNCESPQEALVLLLEADVEWNQHPNLNNGVWKTKVDNYGLLQLDIAWTYLQLESLSNLPDSLQRLDEAERVLRKQVHPNFIPLALTQAELGNAREVPPLAAVFAKLFLLQGIAYLCDSSSSSSSSSSPPCPENSNRHAQSASQSRERLDQAFVLLQCLRSVAPEESVQQLLHVMGSSSAAGGGAGVPRPFTASDAIAALRKAHGDLDAAAVALAEEEGERRRIRRDRDAQHHYGLCQNETDPVNLEHLQTLEPLLKGQRQKQQQEANNWAVDTANTDLSVGLLRLANNDLTRALELYAEQDYNPTKVLSLVDALDQKLVHRGLLGRAVLREKRKKRKLYDDASSPPVDEMALVTLVSMGVDQSKAKKALMNSGNDVEKAMMWLSMDEPEAATAGTGKSKRTDPTSGPVDESETNDVDNCDNLEAKERQEDTPMLENGSDSETAAKRLLELEREAQELLHRELGDILEERDLEREYLGKDLNEEWQLVQKYRRAD